MLTAKINVGSSAGGASGIYLFHNNSGATPAITLDGATGSITNKGQLVTESILSSAALNNKGSVQFGTVDAYSIGHMPLNSNLAFSQTHGGSYLFYSDASTVELEIASGGITVDGTCTVGDVVTSTIADNQFAFAIGTSAAKGGLYNHANGGYLFLRDSSSNGTLTLNGDSGSGLFTGEIKVEGSNTPTGLSSRISKYGSLLIGTSSDAVGDARCSIDSGNGNITSIGTGTFGGDISIQDSSYLRVRATGDNASTAVQLGPDGTGSFASGALSISNVGVTTVDLAGGNSGWAFYASNNDSRTGRPTYKATNKAGGELFGGTNADASANVFAIQSDGSASFAGILESSLLVNTNNTPTVGEGIEVFYDSAASGGAAGSIQAYDRDGAALTRLKIRSSNWEILNDGLATFSNTVKAQQTSNNALSAFEAVDTNGTRFKVTGAGVLSIYDNTLTENVTISSDGSATFAGTITDSKGDLRKIPFKQESNAYTLVAADAGKAIEAQGDITVPNGVFGSGDAITIINDSASDLTISMGSGLGSMFNVASGTSGNLTFGGRGMATIYFVNSTTCYISGSQLS